MKTIRIRKFIILFFLLLLLLPWIFLVAAHLIGTKTVSFQLNDTQKKNLSETVHLIETNTEKLDEPRLATSNPKQIKNYEHGCENSFRNRSGNLSLYL